MSEDDRYIIKYSVDPDYVHDSSADALELLGRIDSGDVNCEMISTSQKIMASLAFDKNEWLPKGWRSATEKDLLNRLDDGQIKAIKAFKQAKL